MDWAHLPPKLKTLCLLGLILSPLLREFCYCLCRYLLEIAIPTNHRQRLDLTARLRPHPNGTLPAQEGLLGRTIAPLVGLSSQTASGTAGHFDILQEWASELDTMKDGLAIQARLRRNYRVTNLFAKDTGRSAHERVYQDLLFQVNRHMACTS